MKRWALIALLFIAGSVSAATPKDEPAENDEAWLIGKVYVDPVGSIWVKRVDGGKCLAYEGDGKKKTITINFCSDEPATRPPETPKKKK